MALSPREAAEALQSIASTESRSATLHGYREAAPHLVLWGVLWVIGYGLTHAMPTRAAAIWGMIVVLGLAADTLTMFRKDGRSAASCFVAIAATLAVFCIATFAIMAPSGRQVAAFIPLVIAASYVTGGIWLGNRYIVAGIAVAVLTLGGFFLLREYFLLWMAVVGGGALLLAGLWLSRA
jgi:hypothetical protein